MDSIDLTKIAGCVLFALLVIVGTKTALEFNSGHNGHDTPVGYKLEGDGGEKPVATAKHAPGSAPAAVKAVPSFDAAKVVAMVSSADSGKGAGAFKKCLACHSAKAGEGHKVGPNLWGIVGREKGGVADFTSYSKAMKAKGGTWTLEDLAAFMHKPKKFVPGTKMFFKGFKKDGDIANLLAYMSTLK